MKATEIIRLCNEANEPHLAAGFIEAGITPKRLRARLEEVAYIRMLAGRARSINEEIPSDFADELVAAGVGVAETKEIIGNRLVEMQSPEIINSIPVGDDPRRGNHGWDAVIDAAKAKAR